jgi:hypothetical protein
MNDAMKFLAAAFALGLAFSLAPALHTRAAAPGSLEARFMLAQAMVPPTGMMDKMKPTPMEQRYLDRYPQPARVGDLIGLPILDLNASTLGYVQRVVRTPQGKVDLVVSYSRWWGWFGRPVAVPLEVVGIEGRQFVSLDMAPSAYAAAPTWRRGDDAVLAADATIKVALARN